VEIACAAQVNRREQREGYASASPPYDQLSRKNVGLLQPLSASATVRPSACPSLVALFLNYSHLGCLGIELVCIDFGYRREAVGLQALRMAKPEAQVQNAAAGRKQRAARRKTGISRILLSSASSCLVHPVVVGEFPKLVSEDFSKRSGPTRFAVA
jgi:hypothetical protein